jgi:hypothetical protein
MTKEERIVRRNGKHTKGEKDESETKKTERMAALVLDAIAALGLDARCRSEPRAP